MVVELLVDEDREFQTVGAALYAKQGNLVDADESGTKASTKHLELRLEVIQGHTFRITEKPTRDCVLLYNNVDFSL